MCRRPSPLTELARYRELSRRRDALIREAARMGYSHRRIAEASGLSRSRVTQILQGYAGVRN